ncbi:hypothetical protein BP5796_00276 [Coleophoma crateriformis]|uniref:DUF7918 domain-containing protein n=1 Tax=Coleophoma crateriformis TaxID=565419 RepID=A0A3D8T7G4_9HELO|nr:hypothetical protein BP5796_00276 [Coleophoma crateriformis]
MPCFKGIAVSVHTEGAPLAEHSVTKQSRVSRVNTYIPVPKPKIPAGSTSNKPEPSKFAISITLLTPGLPVPYSTPKATAADPYPKPQVVGHIPGDASGTSRFVGGSVGPYIPITKSENETIAAYIYFDGRAKEEVATLLRPGEETWVNSRWVQVPDSEGGGLAEREFLFREVGLERWLNGLDLEGSDAAAKIERRRQKFAKRRSRRKEEMGSDDESMTRPSSRKAPGPGVLRYGSDERSPIERLSDEEESFSSLSDDDEPPEAAGQIKVAMFRVLASGEIKRGEYSPQFDAHDDDEEGGKDANGGGDGADIDHTTSFAKPKTLDPKSISTQTVTGIDGPDKPFATFTFFYRGERQLQKMGILASSKQPKATPGSAKRRSTQMDFSNLNPLKPQGTVGFSTFRDNDSSSTRRNKARKKSNGSVGGAMAEDSEEDEDDEDAMIGKMEDVEDKDVKTLLKPEDAKYQGELADGVGRIKLKRQHSHEPMGTNSRSPGSTDTTPLGATPEADKPNADPLLPSSTFGGSVPDESVVGSPLKKHRASLYDINPGVMEQRMGESIGVPAAEAAQKPLPATDVKVEMEEEEL